MNRRSFLASILAAGAAPTIIKASSLMKLVVPSPAKILTYEDIAASRTEALAKSMRYITEEAASKVLWPGIEVHWDKAYAALVLAKFDVLPYEDS